VYRLAVDFGVVVVAGRGMAKTAAEMVRSCSQGRPGRAGERLPQPWFCREIFHHAHRACRERGWHPVRNVPSTSWTV